MIPIIANIFPLYRGSFTTVTRPSSERIKPTTPSGSPKQQMTNEAILKQKPQMQRGWVPRRASEMPAVEVGMEDFGAAEPPLKNSANSGVLPIGTQTSLPSAFTRLVSITLCSKIQRLSSSLSIGPYSLPSLPITLYILLFPPRTNYHCPNRMKRKNNVSQNSRRLGGPYHPCQASI